MHQWQHPQAETIQIGVQDDKTMLESLDQRLQPSRVMGIQAGCGRLCVEGIALIQSLLGGDPVTELTELMRLNLHLRVRFC